VIAQSAAVTAAEFALFELAQYRLPFFDEAVPPWNNPGRQPAPAVARWLNDMGGPAPATDRPGTLTSSPGAAATAG
jgi:hypothetical protein